jgi:hypothetical protein
MALRIEQNREGTISPTFKARDWILQPMLTSILINKFEIFNRGLSSSTPTHGQY